LKGYPFALALAFGTLLLLVWLLRTRRLREKYAFLWIALALGICILGAFPRFLFILASLLGVSTPINVLFSSSLVVLFLVSVHISAEVSKLEEETRTLAETIALLQLRVEELESEQEE